MFKRPSLLALVALLTAPVSLAQTGGWGNPALDPQTHEFPDGAAYGAGGEFTRVAVGSFFDTNDTDVVMLKGQSPVVGITPGHSTSFVPASSDPLINIVANDIATLPGGGALDKLLTVGPAGVQSVVFDTTTWSFVTSTIAAGTDWDDAILVRPADIDADGDQDIVVVASDEVTVRCIEWDQVQSLWVPGFEFTQAYPIRDLELPRWPTDRAVFLFTSWGFRVHEANSGGALLGQRKTNNNDDHAFGGHSMDTLPELDNSVAAVFYNKTSTFQVLLVFHPTTSGGLSHEPAISFAGQYEVASLQAADVDGDTDADIVLVKANAPEGVILLNDGDPFDLSTPFPFDLFSDTNTSEPGIADFDLDGVVDGVIPGPQTGTDGIVGFSSNLGQSLPQQLFSARGIYPCGITWDCNDDTLRFDLHYYGLGGTPDYNSFYIECWQRLVTSSTTNREQLFTAIANYGSANPGEDDWAITVDAASFVQGVTYYFVIRPFDTTMPNRYGPKVILAMSSDLDDLEDHVNNDWTEVVDVIGLNCPSSGLTTQHVISPIDIPPFPAGAPRTFTSTQVGATALSTTEAGCGT